MKRTVVLLLALVLVFAAVSAPVATAENEEAAFVKLGLEERVTDLSEAVGKKFDYITADTPGGHNEITANVSVNWCKFNSESTNVYLPEGSNPATATSFSGLDSEVKQIENVAGQGYEWRGIEIAINYMGAEPWAYWAAFQDYYDVEKWDVSKGKFNHADTNQITFDGHTRTCYSLMFGKQLAGGKLTLYQFIYVPAGYDGTVLTLMSAEANSQSTWPWGKHFYDYMNDNSLFFRMR